MGLNFWGFAIELKKKSWHWYDAHRRTLTPFKTEIFQINCLSIKEVIHIIQCPRYTICWWYAWAFIHYRNAYRTCTGILECILCIFTFARSSERNKDVFLSIINLLLLIVINMLRECMFYIRNTERTIMNETSHKLNDLNYTPHLFISRHVAVCRNHATVQDKYSQLTEAEVRCQLSSSSPTLLFLLHRYISYLLPKLLYYCRNNRK